MNCHKDIYVSHIKTAHYLTSGVANAQSIKGSFEADKNSFVYNKFMKVVMEKNMATFFSQLMQATKNIKVSRLILLSALQEKDKPAYTGAEINYFSFLFHIIHH